MMSPKLFIMSPLLIFVLFAAIALLVLFIILCIKKPWAAAIMALVLLFLIILVSVLKFISFRRIVNHRPTVSVEPSVVQSDYSPVAIWSPGIEDQFEADIYPSKISAVRSLGRRIKRPVKMLWGDQEIPDNIYIIQGENNPQLIEEFGKAIRIAYPEIQWFVRTELPTTGIQQDDVWMKLRIFDIKESAQWQKSDFDPSISSTGRIEASVLKRGGQSTINARFTEKPWVEDFSNFLNRLPHKQYIVARSTESCLTPGEADQQAINDACSHVGPLLTNLQNPIKLSPNDILESDMIVDRFVQSFEGSAGKIWRQALLLDVSNQKINQLALNIANISRARRNQLTRTIFSVAGLLGLITVVYLFLNAATKGYYSWSLRIAGVVLAVILIFLLLA